MLVCRDHLQRGIQGWDLQVHASTTALLKIHLCADSARTLLAMQEQTHDTHACPMHADACGERLSCSVTQIPNIINSNAAKYQKLQPLQVSPNTLLRSPDNSGVEAISIHAHTCTTNLHPQQFGLFSQNPRVDAICRVLCRMHGSSHERVLERSKNCAAVVITDTLAFLMSTSLYVIMFGYGSHFNIMYLPAATLVLVSPLSWCITAIKLDTVHNNPWFKAWKFALITSSTVVHLTSVMVDTPNIPFQNKTIYFVLLAVVVRPAFGHSPWHNARFTKITQYWGPIHVIAWTSWMCWLY